MATFKINGKNFATQDGTGEPTVSSNVGFPTGMVFQTISDNYNSTTETNSSTPVNVCTCTLTTRIARPKIAYWFTTILGGRGDGDNIYVKMTIESGTSASTPSSSNYLPTDNRGPGTGSQDNGLQINNDVMVQGGAANTYPIQHYGCSDVIVTSYAVGTTITVGAFVYGGCYINRSEQRVDQEGGVTSLIVQELVP